jgi:hypothetical protein
MQNIAYAFYALNKKETYEGPVTSDIVGAGVVLVGGDDIRRWRVLLLGGISVGKARAVHAGGRWTLSEIHV